jgi:hypothetical protein
MSPSSPSTSSPKKPQDAWLNELLMENDVYIEDHGFTERVMGQLPPPRASTRWRRPILMVSALLACLVGLVLIPGGAYLTDVLYQVASYRPAQSPLPIVPLAVLLLLVGGGVAAAVHD